VVVNSTLGRFQRNERFLASLLGLFLSSNSEEREQYSRAVIASLFRKVLDLGTRDAESKAKGFARVLIEANGVAIPTHLRATAHFGALAQQSILTPTRWDYAALFLKTLLEIKQRHPGLGLGSANFGVRHGGKELSGLEIAQSWALLGNYGHLFGTFATERALLYRLDETPSLRKSFIGEIDPVVRDPSRRLVNANDLMRVFYPLAAWRISRWKPNETRATALTLLSRLMDPPSDLPWRRVLWAYKHARRIAYSRLHSSTDMQLLMAIPIDRAVRTLRVYPHIGFVTDDHEPRSSLVELLAALDRFHDAMLFRSPRAAELVLTHLRSFKLWWANRERFSFSDRLIALFAEPDDWPSPAQRALRHVVRLAIPDGGLGWPAEVRRWLGDGHVWGDSNFLLTPNHTTRQLLIDVYAPAARLSPMLTAHISTLLAERNQSTWQVSPPTDEVIDCWRSLSLFALKLFEELLVPGRLAHLEPSGGTGYTIFAPSVEIGASRLADFIVRLADTSGRHRELSAVQSVCNQQRSSAGTWFVILGILRIIDSDTGQMLKEIDGVWAYVHPSHVEWYFLEHKDGKRSTSSPLADLQPHLRVQLESVRPITVDSGRASCVSVRSPN